MYKLSGSRPVPVSEGSAYTWHCLYTSAKTIKGNGFSTVCVSRNQASHKNCNQSKYIKGAFKNKSEHLRSISFRPAFHSVFYLLETWPAQFVVFTPGVYLCPPESVLELSFKDFNYSVYKPLILLSCSLIALLPVVFVSIVNT